MAKKPALPATRIDIHNHLWNDPGGDKLIALMDQNAIEATLIMGVPPMGNILSNDGVLAATKKYPGRLVGGCYLDPRDGKKAIKEMRRFHGEGFRVVKLFPNLGYFPDDDAQTPFFDAVAELGMAVLSHCGWLGGAGVGMSHEPWAAYYSHPGRFEKVIRRHPETIFIMAHMGGIAGYLETVMLTTRTPNTYVDCSPGQGVLIAERGGPIVGAIPPTKLLFGADSYDQAGTLARESDALIKQGFGEHLDKIFYSNGRGILEKIGALPTVESKVAKTRKKRSKSER